MLCIDEVDDEIQSAFNGLNPCFQLSSGGGKVSFKPNSKSKQMEQKEITRTLRSTRADNSSRINAP